MPEKLSPEPQIPNLLETSLTENMQAYYLRIMRGGVNPQVAIAINSLIRRFFSETQTSQDQATVGQFLDFYENFSAADWDSMVIVGETKLKLNQQFVQKVRQVIKNN